MLADDPAVLADHDAIGIGVDLDRPPDRARGHRVLVVVEAHQAGLGDRGRHRMESIEAAGIGHELRPFRLEHLPDRLFGQLRMAVRLGVGDALVDAARRSARRRLLNRSRGVKKRSRTSPTWFSTCPFSQPDAGVQATGSTR